MFGRSVFLAPTGSRLFWTARSEAEAWLASLGTEFGGFLEKLTSDLDIPESRQITSKTSASRAKPKYFRLQTIDELATEK